MTERQNSDDNDSNGFEFSGCLDDMISASNPAMDRKRLIEIWSKVQIAEIMQKQAKELLDKAQTDLEFYKLIAAQRGIES